MKAEWITYLTELGLSRTLIQKATGIHQFYERFVEDEITDIFVTNIIDSDGRTQFENLWFLSNRYVYEASNFITEDHFDMACIHKRVVHWYIKKENFDFLSAATKASRATLHAQLDAGIIMQMNASESNCDKLKHILVTYVIPNFQTVEISS